MARTRPYHGFIAQSLAGRAGHGSPPPPTNKGLNLKLQQEGCRLDFRETQSYLEILLSNTAHGYSPGSRVACLEAGPATSLPGVGVSDSVTLFKEWDGTQGGELGRVYNNASCLH